MNTLTYNMPNDIHTYTITCPDELLDMYMKLLFENGAYKVAMDIELVFDNIEDYELYNEFQDYELYNEFQDYEVFKND